MEVLRQLYGRHLEDFEVGRTYAHPWEVTIDQGEMALFGAAFMDAMPIFASKRYAEALGFRARPVHSMLLFNLGLSFSVHDVSEQCIAHLAYLNLRFPRAVYAGDTLYARSTVLDLTAAHDRSRGVVHVRTCVFNQLRQAVCWLERKALVPGGNLELRPYERYPEPEAVPSSVQPLPPELATLPPSPGQEFGFSGHFEDFVRGQVFCHHGGRTITEAEGPLLASLVRNTHPLHTDARYCDGGGSFTGRPVVMEGLVFAWATALTSRDLCGNAVWELGYEDGAHTAPVHAGDTLYVASRVTSLDSVGEDYGALQTRLVAVKNARPEALMEEGHDLFKPERHKAKDARCSAKVLEITRRVLVRRRP